MTPTFVCQACWKILDDVQAAETRCPECGSSAPTDGFAPMPFRYRQRFVFVTQLGRGGQGAVFHAVDLHGEGRDVAVKVVRTLNLANPTDPKLARRLAEHNSEVRRRFDLESGAAGHLGGSSYFVEVLAYEKGSQPYLVMEYVKFPTLDAFMAKRRKEADPLSALEVAAFGKELLTGIGVMHGHNIVHRDLKPGNLFVEYEHGRWQVKITDLGIWTRAGDQPEGVEVSLGPTIPLNAPPPPPQVRGTPGWMSPEQQDCQPLSAPSDLHAVGSILWWMYTHEVPYPVDRNLWALAQAAQNDADRIAARDNLWTERRERLRHLPGRPARMPEGFYRILCRVFAFDASQRFQRASEFRDALDAFLRAEEEASRAALDDARKRVTTLREEVGALGVGLRTFEDFARARQALDGVVADLAQQLENPGALDLTEFRADIASRERELVALRARIEGHLQTSRPPPPPDNRPPPKKAPVALWGVTALTTTLIGIAGWYGGRSSVPTTTSAQTIVPVCDAGVQAITTACDAATVRATSPVLTTTETRQENAWIAVAGTPVELHQHEVSRREYRAWELSVGHAHPIAPDLADDTPVTDIPPDQAAEFCRAIGARLASEDTWRHALAGWSPDVGGITRSAWPHSVHLATTSDTTPSGHRDLLGNVSEWIASTPPQESLRLGGNYGMSGQDALAATRTPQRYANDPAPPHFPSTGFRCERDRDATTPR